MGCWLPVMPMDDTSYAVLDQVVGEEEAEEPGGSKSSEIWKYTYIPTNVCETCCSDNSHSLKLYVILAPQGVKGVQTVELANEAMSVFLNRCLSP